MSGYAILGRLEKVLKPCEESWVIQRERESATDAVLSIDTV
jgi:hypothetical protein